jgi:hypothetical protein
MIPRASILFTLLMLPSFAAEFKAAKECVIGTKVMDRDDQAGTVVSSANSMCRVRFDISGKEVSYLFWMLRPAGASRVTDDTLVPGTYKCYGSAGYLFMDIHIGGPKTYRDKHGTVGEYRLDASSGKIVFESGPFVKATAQLLAGPKIGLNMNGGTFYATTCGLRR